MFYQNDIHLKAMYKYTLPLKRIPAMVSKHWDNKTKNI